MKRKNDVCGKPTQYNLQTLQYDWKELPDTHFALFGNEPGRRGGSAVQAPYATDNMPPPRAVPPRGYEAPSAKLNAISATQNDYGYGAGVNADAEEVPLDYTPYMQWSHDDIRQRLRSNLTEANRSYFQNGLP